MITIACQDILLRYEKLSLFNELLKFRAPIYIERFGVAAAISTMAGAIAATRETPYGQGLIHYLCLCAGSGTGKGAPISFSRDVLTDVHKMLVATRKPRSDAGLARRFREQPALTYFLEEFGSWFETISKSTVSSQQGIATFFLEAWDCPAIVCGGDTSKELDSSDAVAFPCLNLLASMTNDAYSRIINLDSVKHDGLGGRLEPIILTKEEEKSFIDIGDMPTKEELESQSELFGYQEKYDELTTFISKIASDTIEDIEKHENLARDENNQREYNNITFRKRKPFKITTEARKAFDTSRREMFELKHSKSGIAEHSLARICARSMRTACLLAAWDSRNEVDDFDFNLAFNFHYANFATAERVLIIEENENNHAKIEQRIISMLEQHGPLKWSEFSKHDSWIRHKGGKVLDEVKTSMLKNNKISITRITGKGRPFDVVTLITGD